MAAWLPTVHMPMTACGWREAGRTTWWPLVQTECKEGKALMPGDLPSVPAGRTMELRQGPAVLRVSGVGADHALATLLGKRGYHLPMGHRAVLAALWEGRLRFVPAKVLPPIETVGETLLKRCIASSADVVATRRDLQACITASASVPRGDLRVCVAATEAMVNALRYAGRGWFELTRTEHGLQVRVEDRGPGIAFSQLAKCLLMPRDVATVGRGQGFWLMLAYASACWLWSGAGGTRVILRFDFRESRQYREVDGTGVRL